MELKSFPLPCRSKATAIKAEHNGDVDNRRLIGEAGKALTEDDLRRINTPRSIQSSIKSKNVDLEEGPRDAAAVASEELRQLQVELVRLRAGTSPMASGLRFLSKYDAAGKGGTIRRFTEHSTRAMRVVALPADR